MIMLDEKGMEKIAEILSTLPLEHARHGSQEIAQVMVNQNPRWISKDFLLKANRFF